MATKITIKRNTPTLDRYIKGIKDIDPIVKVSAVKLQGDLLSAYAVASNLSNKSKNKGLTAEYSAKKADSGRAPIRDLNVSGKLTQSFGVRKEGDAKYSVGPRGSDEQKKMEGNIKYDENLMKVGKKTRREITTFVNERIKRGGK